MFAEIRRILRTGKGGHRKRFVAAALHVACWPLFLLPRMFWPRRRAGRAELPDDARILLIRVDGIGDLAMTSMIFPALRRRFPRGSIELLISSAAKPIAELLVAAGWIDRLHVLPLLGRTLKLHLAMARELRARRFDAGIDLRGDLRNIFIMWLAGIPRRIGMSGTGLIYLLTDIVHLPALQHQSEESRQLIARIGVSEIEPWPMLPLREQDLREADEFLARQGAPSGQAICAFHLGAFQPSKVWPIDRFAAVARQLHTRFEAQVLVVGGKDEIAIANEFAQKLDRDVPIIIAAGQTSLTVTAALLHRCSVLIGNDSGPAHLAAAVGCPVVVLFGPAPPQRYRPLSPSVVMLRSPRPCEPGCDKVCMRPSEHCLLDVTADAVIHAASRFIESRTRGGSHAPPVADTGT